MAGKGAAAAEAVVVGERAAKAVVVETAGELIVMSTHAVTTGHISSTRDPIGPGAAGIERARRVHEAVVEAMDRRSEAVVVNTRGAARGEHARQVLLDQPSC